MGLAAFIVLLVCGSAWAQGPKAVVEGIVINAASKAPIAGAAVRLAGKGAELASNPDVEPLFAKTDKAGRFTFNALVPDLYTLLIRSPGSLPVGKFLRVAFVDLRVAREPTPYKTDNGPEITVIRSTDRNGTLRAKVRIALSYYATIGGKVTSPEGVPMGGCLMEMYQEAPAGLSEREKRSAEAIPGTQRQVLRMSGLIMSTNDLGEYHAAHLEPGTYYVKERCGEVSPMRLWKPGYRETFYPSAASIESAQPIRVAAGERVRADIRISEVKGARIAGRHSVEKVDLAIHQRGEP